MLLISSCITGINCRYNATSSYNKNLLNRIKVEYIHICPEILAGFTVPRKPCEIFNGSGEDVLNGNAKVIDSDGVDVTEKMLFGAKKAIKICLGNNVIKAYLQARSPTCGVNKIYDGTFTSTLRNGNGVFSTLLKINKIEVEEVG